MAVESLDDSGEVCQAACEPVDLVDDNDVHFLRFHVLQQLLECRSFHRSAGISAIVIVSWQGFPALLALAKDKGFACLALCIERVEGLFEAFFGGFSSVNCAALDRLL